jgi:hypothetical protein
VSAIGELDGVAHEIHQDLADAHRVPHQAHRHPGRDDDLERELLLLRPQIERTQRLFDQFVRPTPRSRPQPETAGEAGDGVWAIYMSGDDGKAHVEQVYKSELDALRANKLNTDPSRNVRFLPYGIDVSVLDAASGDARSDDAQHDAVEP